MTLANGDLTTLATMQAYYGTTNAPNSALLSGLITRTSRMILTYLNRSILVPKTYTQQFNGSGTTSLVIPNWPLLDIISLAISGAALTIAPQLDNPVEPSNPYGWRFQPWDGAPPGFPATVELVGGAWYYYGNQNVVFIYKAGYEVQDEVPNSATYTPLQPYGIWATDEGVVYSSDGTALTAITTGSPAVGEYKAPTPNATVPVYTYSFNATDIITGLEINYGYVPADLEQACIEAIMEASSYRTRVGYRSQTLASQESITFDNSGLPPRVQQMCYPYKSVLPPAMGANV